MKRLLALLCSALFTLTLAACGGGGGGSSSASDTSGSAAVTTLQITDTVVGSGNPVVAGKTVTINYTAYLYDVTAADKLRGTFVDSSTAQGGSFTFVVGTGQVITGMDQGILGMRPGGKRTLVVPSSMAYGSTGSGKVPANRALVFDIDLITSI